MVEFFKLIVQFFKSILSTLGSHITITDFHNQSFNYLGIIFGAIVISMMINVFWKGGKG